MKSVDGNNNNNIQHKKVPMGSRSRGKSSQLKVNTKNDEFLMNLIVENAYSKGTFKLVCKKGYN
jgi:hypothetical protein